MTVQNTKGVRSVIPIPSNEIKNQIIFSAKDIKPNGIKIGMLHSKLVIKKVVESLKMLRTKKIVLDPVMVAKGGAKLIDNEAIKILKNELMPKVSLITPNIPEAEVLTGLKINSRESMLQAANELINLGAKNVLIKGGHLKSKNVEDIFLNKSDFKIFTSPRYKTNNTHGTGCTLSSAITTFFHVEKVLRKLVS